MYKTLSKSHEIRMMSTLKLICQKKILQVQVSLSSLQMSSGTLLAVTHDVKVWILKIATFQLQISSLSFTLISNVATQSLNFYLYAVNPQCVAIQFVTFVLALSLETCICMSYTYTYTYISGCSNFTPLHVQIHHIQSTLHYNFHNVKCCCYLELLTSIDRHGWISSEGTACMFSSWLKHSTMNILALTTW